MDIKIIISMFEDLKKLISEQFSNLSKLVESLANAKSDQPALPIIPQQVDLSELENHASHTKELIQEGFKKHQEQLDELNCDINYGDYIGFADREDNIKYFTVTNDGKIYSDNAHTRVGYKGYYRSITCVTADANEFNPQY